MLPLSLSGLAVSTIAAAVAMTTWPAPLAPNPPREPSSRTVSLYVTVEKDGGLISGLGVRNFRLYEDGEPRPFRLDMPETPVTVALLIEYSSSSWLYFNDISSAVRGFFAEAPEGNWYALATFANSMKVEVDFTKQKGKILSGFSDLSPPFWNEVNTYDALVEMLDKLDRLPGRRVLIFIGSGIDTFSSNTLDDVRRRAEQVNVTIFCLAAGSLLRGSYEPYLNSTARLTLLQAEAFHRMLADTSGGEAWFPRFEGAFDDVMKGIMQTIKHQYRLVYESRIPRDRKLHRIKLEAFHVADDRREDFNVRAREGFRR